jgi:hypothetical protein
MELPTSLFTTQSLLSFGGAVVATALVPNVIATVASLPPRTLRLIALIVAMALAFLMAFLVKEGDWTKWIVAFFNGLLIYLSALGANETLSRGMGRAPAPATPALAEAAIGGGTEKRKFFASWF